MTNDRLRGNEVPLTHEFLSLMLGVRQVGVTVALHYLEQRALDVRLVPEADICQFDEPDRFLLLNLIIVMAALLTHDNNYAAVRRVAPARAKGED